MKIYKFCYPVVLNAFNEVDTVGQICCLLFSPTELAGISYALPVQIMSKFTTHGIQHTEEIRPVIFSEIDSTAVEMGGDKTYRAFKVDLEEQRRRIALSGLELKFSL